MNLTDLQTEFDRQVKNLLDKGYPQMAKMPVEEFMNLVSPLRAKLNNLDLPGIDLENGYLPFVLVVSSRLIPVDSMMAVIERNNEHGVVALRPLIPVDFKLIDQVLIPDTDIYLLLDIDRGKDYLNVTPNQALVMIKEEARSPLTIDEGIALVTQFPDFLRKNNCFSLLASRTGKDKRVPAIWINAKKQANLGWCWDGNPHTWLGSASAKNRLIQ